MPGERQLRLGCEDADANVAVSLGREHEDGLREVRLARQGLHPLVGEVARVREDGELVALERRVREDVHEDEAQARHEPTLASGAGCRRAVLRIFPSHAVSDCCGKAGVPSGT